MKREKGRGYSWPSFSEGHQLSRTHGAHAGDVPEVAAPRAAELASLAPWLALPTMGGAAMDVAVAEVMVARLLAAVEEHGVIDPETGNVRPVVDQVRRYLTTLSNLRTAAALTPAGLTKLVGELSKVEGTAAQDLLNQLREVGRAIRTAADARALPAAPGPESDDDRGEVTP